MIIYIMCPFSHPDAQTRNARFEAANRYAAGLMSEGHIVFSPLSHSVPISRYLGNPNDSDFYVNQDLFWLQYCDKAHVLMLEGWTQSTGIRRELDETVKLNITVKFIKPIQIDMGES